MTGWLMLVASIVFNVAGNLLVKTFSSRTNINSAFDYLSLPFLFGIGAFGLGVVFYGRALHEIPIVLAYPIQVGTCVLAIAIVAVSVFGERLDPQTLAGIVLVMTGIAVLSRAA